MASSRGFGVKLLCRSIMRVRQLGLSLSRSSSLAIGLISLSSGQKSYFIFDFGLSVTNTDPRIAVRSQSWKSVPNFDDLAFGMLEIF